MFINDVICEMEVRSFTYPASTAFCKQLYGITSSVKSELVVEIGCIIEFSTLHCSKTSGENR
jgi:hypothetical protein